eukprot:gene13867-16353_t
MGISKGFELFNHRNRIGVRITDPYELSNSIKVLKYVLATKQCDINAIDGKGNAALHYSCEYNFMDVALLLLENGCDRNLKNQKGLTSLHVAVKAGNLGISNLLAKNGAQSIPDGAMKTPLQYIVGYDKSVLQSIIFTNEVFLSYAHKDLGFVRELRTTLETFSLRCWLDEYRLQAGCDWRAEITKGVENSQVVVFTLSETSYISLWCRKELKMARKIGKIIIALYFNNMPADPVLRGLFDYEIRSSHSERDFASLDKESKRCTIEKLAKTIKTLLNGCVIQKPPQSQKDLYQLYPGRTVYVTFADEDQSLRKLVREVLTGHGVPTIDRVDVMGADSLLLDTSNGRQSKKKPSHPQRTARGAAAAAAAAALKPQTTYISQHYIAPCDDKEMDIPVLDVFVSSDESDYHPLNRDFQAHHHAILVESERSLSGPVVHDEIKALKPLIDDCLLHLVIYTKKTIVSKIIKEIEYSLSLNKPVFLVTTDYTALRLNCPELLVSKKVTWFEIAYQREDEFFDKIIFNYEVLERTYGLEQRIKLEIEAAAAAANLVDEEAAAC